MRARVCVYECVHVRACVCVCMCVCVCVCVCVSIEYSDPKIQVNAVSMICVLLCQSSVWPTCSNMLLACGAHMMELVYQQIYPLHSAKLSVDFSHSPPH